MPLSEEEQRILHEIERNFYEDDPDFAKQVQSTTVYRHSGRLIRVAAVGFLLGLVLVISQISHPLIAFVGFLVMLGCAVVIERNMRRIGRAGVQEVSYSWKTGGLPNPIESVRNRLRRHFDRE